MVFPDCKHEVRTHQRSLRHLGENEELQVFSEDSLEILERKAHLVVNLLEYVSGVGIQLQLFELGLGFFSLLRYMSNLYLLDLDFEILRVKAGLVAQVAFMGSECSFLHKHSIERAQSSVRWLFFDLLVSFHLRQFRNLSLEQRRLAVVEYLRKSYWSVNWVSIQTYSKL